VHKVRPAHTGQPGEVDMALIKVVVPGHKSWQHAATYDRSFQYAVLHLLDALSSRMNRTPSSVLVVGISAVRMRSELAAFGHPLRAVE